MIGDAVPIRFSRRIQRKASRSPVRVSVKKMTRRSAIKRKTCVNSTLVKATVKNKVGRKSKSEKNHKQTSGLNSSLLKVTEKTKPGTKSKTVKKIKQISKQPSRSLKPATHEIPGKKITEIFDCKRKTRSSLNASQVNIKNNEKQHNLEQEERKKSFDHKNCKKCTGNKINSVRRSFRVSKSAQLAEDIKLELFKKGNKSFENKNHKKSTSNKINPVLSSSRVSKSSQLADDIEVELFKRENKSFGNKKRKKSTGYEISPARSSLRVSKSSHLVEDKVISNRLVDSNLKPSRVKKPTQKKSALRVTSFRPKSVLTPKTRKSLPKTKHSKRKKSSELSTESLNPGISLHTPISKSPLVAQPPEKFTRTTRHSENKKSIRLSKGSNQSRIPSSEISPNTSAFETPHPAKHSEKRKSIRLSKGSNQSQTLTSEISLNTTASHSILETPQPEKYSGKRKSSRILEPTPLRTLNKEPSLSTPVSVFGNNQDSMLSTSQLSKGAELPAAKSPVRKRGRRKVSNKVIAVNGFEKLKQSRGRKVNQQIKTSENFKLPLSKVTHNIPLDVLSTPDFEAIRPKSASDKCVSKPGSKSTKRKLHHSATENRSTSDDLRNAKKRKKSAVADFPNVGAKGTLKHKRWLLSHFKESYAGYEDDLFENQCLDQYKNFHFGDESDGSSVNIATPKFDCILTPSLPKKTPHFKDCISPSELLQARKAAEEYLYRRNKKRKSGDMPSSSGNTTMSKTNTTQDIPEKKKLDFAETVNKLIEVQKNLEKGASIGDEEEDSYFSDASN